MAAILCDICGGSLSMDASGDFAVCESCGMKHTKDRVKAMAQEITGTVVVSNIASIESLMKRGHLALEDSQWQEADEYFDKVLDINAEYAPAYVGKLCSELRARQEEQLSKVGYDSKYIDILCTQRKMRQKAQLAKEESPIAENSHYQKAVRFAQADYREKLESYNKTIQDRIVADYERMWLNYEKAIVPLHSYKTLIAAKKEDAEKKDAEIRKKYEEDMKSWQENVRQKQEQSDWWKSQKLCPHCGSKIGLFSDKCKVCKKTVSKPVQMPYQPPAPKYNAAKLNDSNIFQSILVSLGGYDWRVLDIQDDKALLLCEKIIGKLSGKAAIWEMMNYMHGQVMFTAVERAMIAEAKIAEKENTKIFLLSEEEVRKYLSDNSIRTSTDAWWLRSRGARIGSSDFYYPACVWHDGSIKVDWWMLSYQEAHGIRPALWLNLQ